MSVVRACVGGGVSVQARDRAQRRRDVLDAPLHVLGEFLDLLFALANERYQCAYRVHGVRKLLATQACLELRGQIWGTGDCACV